MTDEMRSEVILNANQQYHRWGPRVPSVAIVRAWLQDSLGFNSASSADAKEAQRILRSEWKDRRIPHWLELANRRKSSKQNPAGLPTGKFLNITGDARVKKIRFNKSGTVDIVVLDKPAKKTKRGNPSHSRSEAQKEYREKEHERRIEARGLDTLDPYMEPKGRKKGTAIYGKRGKYRNSKKSLPAKTKKRNNKRKY